MKSLTFKVELDLEFRRAGYNDTPPEHLEPNLSETEVDTFMIEPFMIEYQPSGFEGPEGNKLPRYHFYAQSVAGFLYLNVKGSENKIWDIQYAPGGKLSFIIELSGKNVEQQGFDLADNLYEYGLGKEGGWSPYEGGIGNEFVIPSRKKYREMEWEESSSEEESDEENEDSDSESKNYDLESSDSEDERDYMPIGHIDFRDDKRIRVTKLS
jgi:hypothetical protein